MKKASIEELQRALRVGVAVELVSNMGISKAQAAKMLDLTPSALTQYFNGTRGAKYLEYIRQNRKVEKTIQLLAHGIARDYSGGRIERINERFLSATLKLNEGGGGIGKMELLAPESSESMPWLEALRKRLDEEQHAATECLQFSQNSPDELTRMLFRQIASNSLRHADIVSFLMANMEKRSPFFGSKPPKIRAIEEMIRKEETAGDADIMFLRKKLGPSAALLIESIEADERKHLMLLKGLEMLIKKNQGGK